MTRALLVVDMLNDFVTGKIANPRAERIIPNIASLLDMARRDDDWLVVYANDAHLPGDFELKVWGEHAMAGTDGAAIIPQLAAADGDFVLPKRFYSSFHETGLDPCRGSTGWTPSCWPGGTPTSASATPPPTPSSGATRSSCPRTRWRPSPRTTTRPA
jgi:isochorismate hydrolase